MYFFNCFACFKSKKKRNTNISDLKTGTSIYYRDEKSMDINDPFLYS